jgi:hypothetical protein
MKSLHEEFLINDFKHPLQPILYVSFMNASRDLKQVDMDNEIYLALDCNLKKFERYRDIIYYGVENTHKLINLDNYLATRMVVESYGHYPESQYYKTIEFSYEQFIGCTNRQMEALLPQMTTANREKYVSHRLQKEHNLNFLENIHGLCVDERFYDLYDMAWSLDKSLKKNVTTFNTPTTTRTQKLLPFPLLK